MVSADLTNVLRQNYYVVSKYRIFAFSRRTVHFKICIFKFWASLIFQIGQTLNSTTRRLGRPYIKSNFSHKLLVRSLEYFMEKFKLLQEFYQAEPICWMHLCSEVIIIIFEPDQLEKIGSIRWKLVGAYILAKIIWVNSFENIDKFSIF